MSTCNILYSCWMVCHVPIIGGRSGEIQTWLRKQRTGRSSDTPGTSPPVGAECNARLICTFRRFDHVTDALVSLHWLRVPERVVYKIAVLTFKFLHGIAPEYRGPVVCVADLPGRQSIFALLALTAWWCHRLNCQQLALERSQVPVLASGIVCQQTFRWHRHCWPSAND